MVIIMRETKSKKIAPKPKKEDNNMKNTEIEKAIAKAKAKLLIFFIATPRFFTAKLNIGNRNVSNKKIWQETREI